MFDMPKMTIFGEAPEGRKEGGRKGRLNEEVTHVHTITHGNLHRQDTSAAVPAALILSPRAAAAAASSHITGEWAQGVSSLRATLNVWVESSSQTVSSTSAEIDCIHNMSDPVAHLRHQTCFQF